MPGFIKLDFSDLPCLIGAFAYGPFAGVGIAFLKNVIHMTVSQSGFVGELSNFVLGSILAFTAGIIYKYKKTKKNAVAAALSGSAMMAALSVPLNNIIIYPLYYYVMGLPKQSILDMYRLILPSVRTIPQALLIFNAPFTLAKGILCSVIALLIYKPLTKILK